MSQMTISRDSNLIYLPLVYFLPEELIAKCPTLLRLPRKVREVLRSETLVENVNSDQFLSEVLDAGAALAFPHFGFRGWKEDYTGYFPVWQLSYAVQGWCRGLEVEIGWGLQALFNVPSTQSIEFFAPEYIKTVMERIVKRTIAEQKWQPILDAIHEMPCAEDFERRRSNVRKDFYRKWYHSRSKQVQMISFE